MPSSVPVLAEYHLYRYLDLQIFSCAGRPQEDRVGIEVEFFPLLRERLGTQQAQPGREGDPFFSGLYPWLLSVAERHGWHRESDPASCDLAFLLPGSGRLTLEPGGQIEYSSPPFASADEALDDVEAFESFLRREGETVGLIFLSEGFNGMLGDADPSLVVPKPRYLAMDSHFQEIGPFGRQMMRRTCATQINLDFGDMETAPLRWRAANIIAPPLNALFANSPHVLDGTAYTGYRYEIWRRADPCRAGCSVGIDDPDPVSAYLRFALDASVMLEVGPDGECRRPERHLTFRSWLRGEKVGEEADGTRRYPDMKDWELHLTTLFPHVRPRGFLELRSIDALPAGARRAAVVLAASLLYNAGLCAAVIRLFRTWKKEIRKERNGSPHGFPNIPADDREERFAFGKKLLEMAIEETGHPALHEYYRDFTRHGRTPADAHRDRERLPA